MEETSVKQVFLSYATEDTDFARRLADDLKRLGVRVWIASDSIRPGEEWVDAIERGLRESSHIVIVLTPAALEASGAKMERDMAITLALEDRIEVISLRWKPCEAPLVLSRYQMILAFEEGYDAGLNQLAGYLGLQVEPSEPEEKKKPEPTGRRLPGLALLALVTLPVIAVVFIVVFLLGDGLNSATPTTGATWTSTPVTKLPPGLTPTSTPATQTAVATREAQTESPPPTNTQIPSDTTPSSVATLTCDVKIEDSSFEEYWGKFKDRLRCPEQQVIKFAHTGEPEFVEQKFNKGYMVWVRDGDFHFAFVDDPRQNHDGRWYQMLGDELNRKDGEMSPSCEGKPAVAMRTADGPISGFSALWCADELSVELYEEIGQAEEGQGEKKDEGNLLLIFNEGYMLRTSTGDDYILIRESRNESVEEGIYYIRK